MFIPFTLHPSWLCGNRFSQSIVSKTGHLLCLKYLSIFWDLTKGNRLPNSPILTSMNLELRT